MFRNQSVYDAYEYARDRHANQTDKAGKPYFDHVLRVADRVADSGAPTEAVIAALLHDTVKDTDTTTEQIESRFGSTVAEAVSALTKAKNEPLDSYLDRVKSNPLAVIVKRADALDNSDPDRLAVLDSETRARLTVKYSKVLAALGLD